MSLSAPLVPGVKPGMRCTIEIENPEIGEDVAYPTLIEELEEELLFVGWPLQRDQPVEVSTGSHVRVTVPIQTGATLFIDCEVVRRRPATAGEPVPTLGVRVLAVGRQQQRAHFRLSVALQPIDCAIWATGTTGTTEVADAASAPPATDPQDGGAQPVEEAAAGNWQPLSATISDISGGGVGLRVPHELPDGARLWLRFPYPMADGVFAGDVRVKSVIPLTGAESTGGAHFKIGTAFDSTVDRACRERLVRCIARCQLEQRRREND